MTPEQLDELIKELRGRDAVLFPLYGKAAAALEELKREKEMAKNAIKVMAEDGWLYCGTEGMSDAQKTCYDAYINLGLEEPSDEQA